MTPLTHIEICNGLERKSEIEAFYQREGSSIDIQRTDLFFIARAKNEILGCVRFCVENQIPMLRTMRVAKSVQRRKIGLELLRRFALHLNDEEIRNTHCLPHSNLEAFYGKIGFRKISGDEIPLFLRERMTQNASRGYELICMRRD